MKKLGYFLSILLLCSFPLVSQAQETTVSTTESVKTQLVDIGMHDGPVDLLALMNNPLHKTVFSRKDHAMVAWVRVLNVKKADQQEFVFYSPDGNIYRRAIKETVTMDHKEWFAVAGYSLHGKDIPKAYDGEWRVVYSIKSGDGPWQEMGETRFSLKN